MSNQAKFVDIFDTVLLSCDDIPWDLEEECAKFIDTVNELKVRGKRLLYVSSDDAKSRRQIVQELTRLQIHVNVKDVVCLSYLLAVYLKKRLNRGKVFLIGSPEVSEELSAIGICNFGSGADTLETDLATFVHTFQYDVELDAVVVAFDQHLSYPKLVRAGTFLNNSKVDFMATSRRHPTKGIVTCAECCSGREAFVFEDSQEFKDTLQETLNLDPEKTLFLCTRSETENLFGERCGFKTLSALDGLIKEDSSDKCGNSIELK